MQYNNITSSFGIEIVNLFTEYISKTYSAKYCILNDTALLSGEVNLSQFSIPVASIYKKLYKLDTNKRPGSDGLPSPLIKHCSFLFCRLLSPTIMSTFRLSKEFNTNC